LWSAGWVNNRHLSVLSRPTWSQGREPAACGGPPADVVGTLSVAAHAQSLTIDLGAAGHAGTTSRLVQITALVTLLSLAPSLLVIMTAFTRIIIVLSLLRSALATQSTPPSMVLIGLALLLTFFVMQPGLDQAWTTGLLPLTQGRVDEMEGLRLTAETFHHFMLANLRGSDLQVFLDIAHLPTPATADAAPWRALIPPSWWASCAAPWRSGSCCSCHSW
jgi:flagellar biosynthetic protein FliP